MFAKQYAQTATSRSLEALAGCKRTQLEFDIQNSGKDDPQFYRMMGDLYDYVDYMTAAARSETRELLKSELPRLVAQLLKEYEKMKKEEIKVVVDEASKKQVMNEVEEMLGAIINFGKK